MKTNRSLARYISLLVVIAMLLGNGVAPPAAAQGVIVLTITGGDGQSALIGTAFADPLQVTVTLDGAPAEGVSVEFIAPWDAGVASLNPAHFSATTNADGVASAAVTANWYAGAFDVSANYGGQTVVFHLTNTGTLALAISGGDGQSAVIGTAYAQPLQVTLTVDEAPVEGASIEFNAPWAAGVASLDPPHFSATTGDDGVASSAATANWIIGSYEVSASFAGASALFRLTNHNNSRCECNLAVVHPEKKCNDCADQTTRESCESYAYCWWRKTDAQNALVEHSMNEWTGTTSIVYNSSGLKAYLYSAVGGSNVTVLTTPHNALIIGVGGDRQLTLTALAALRNRIPGFLHMSLSGIVLPDAHKSSYWGASIWLSAFNKPDATIYANRSFSDSILRRSYATAEWDQRESYAQGRDLPWANDLFLGAGWAKEYRPTVLANVPPNELIETQTNILVENETVTLIPTTAGDGGLAVWVPRVRILILGNMGAYLPTLGGIAQLPVPVDDQLDALDRLRDLGAGLLVMEHGLPIDGAAEVSAALTAQYEALEYLKEETVKAINRQEDIEDIVNEVHLTWELIGPYTREFVGLEAFVIRQIYTEYMGWFDGDVAHLESLSQREEDVRLMKLGGGEKAVLTYVKDCLSEHTRNGAVAALDYLGPLRRVYPSATADAYYIQALKMLAWTTTSAELRNYYLTEVCHLEGTCLTP